MLPIAFDGQGQMEVDFLSDDTADTRIAVEIDGDQHLADPAAYRRDRRKDLLLQENGYLVLRFLAQDVGKELDRVQGTILRALARVGPGSGHPAPRADRESARRPLISFLRCSEVTPLRVLRAGADLANQATLHQAGKACACRA